MGGCKEDVELEIDGAQKMVSQAKMDDSASAGQEEMLADRPLRAADASKIGLQSIRVLTSLLLY